MRDLKPTIFILSAEHVENTGQSNADDTAELAELLTDCNLTFSEVEGCHNGNHESAFLVVGAGAEHDVCELASQYNQGSYLRSDSDRNTVLVNPDTDEEKAIGIFRRVTAEQAKKGGNYTFQPIDGSYWVAS